MPEVGLVLVLLLIGFVAWRAMSVEHQRTAPKTYGPRPMARQAEAPVPMGDPDDRPAVAAGSSPSFRCLVCGGSHFDERQALLNTTMASFFNVDWANKSAVCLVCRECGYIHWFLPS